MASHLGRAFDMKHAPNLDFTRNRAAAQRWKKAFLAVLGLVAGVQIGVAAWRLQTMETQRSALDAQYRQLAGKDLRNGGTVLTADQMKAAGGARAMLDSLAVPWEGLLSAIEAARTQRVLIDTIQPHSDDGSLSINVSCADFAGVAEFIARLGQQELLQDVMLVSEALPDNGGALRAVISANWRKAK